MPVLVAGLCAVAFATAAAPGHAREALDETGRFGVRWWTADEGLPETPLTGLTLAPDGTLVCVSRSRICRLRDTAVGPEPEPAALTDPLHAAIGDFWSIGFDRSGRLWVQGRQAVARQCRDDDPAPEERAGAWAVYRFGQAVLNALVFDREGRPVCIGPGLVSMFDGTRFHEVVSAMTPAPFRYGTIDQASGDLWLWGGPDTSAPLRLSAPLAFDSPVEHARELASLGSAVVSMGSGPTGALALLADGIAVRSSQTWRRLPTVLPTAEPRIRGKITEGSDGTVWVAGPEGLIAMAAGRVQTTISRLPGFSPQVAKLLADGQGGMWAACAGGLLFVRRLPVEFLAIAGSSAVFVRPDGSLLVGIPGGIEAWRRDAGDWSRESVAKLPAHAVPTALVETADGRIWIGTQDAFIFRADRGRVVQLTNPEPEAFRELRSVHQLASGPDGCIWAATSNGLAAWRPDGDGFQPVAGFGKESPVRVSGLSVEPDGALLAALPGRGLFRLDGRGRAKRLLASRELPGQRAIALFRDSRGVLWVGGEGGLVGIGTDDGVICRLSQATGLVNPAVRQIDEDREGRLWLALRDGRLQGLSLASLDALAAGRAAVVHGTVISLASGMEEFDCTGRIARGFAACRNDCDPDGGQRTLVFASDRGVIMLDEPFAGPAVAVSPPRVLRLDAPDGGIRFESTFPGMQPASPALFQTRLRGFDADWSPPAPGGMREYRGLPPGRYDFESRIVAGETDADFPLASVALRIPPPWWQSPWAALAVVVGAIGASAMASRWQAMMRARRHIARLERLRDRDRDRARIARDIHDSLGAGLTRLALMSENARRVDYEATDMHRRLDAIYCDARTLTRTVDEIVWAVNPLNDTLSEFATFMIQDVEDFAHAGGLFLTLDVPVDIPDVAVESNVRHHLCLAVREAGQNVLRHAAARSLMFSIKVADGALEVVVADDGCGFDVAARPGDEQDGLRNIAARVADVGGTCRIESMPGRGTRIVLTVPVLMVTGEPS